ncbi:hypothetical protein XELAEV_18011148mg [Xenopus laevis]|uniref:Uncharacterized protein n=1 Tax=Xenopus laevis TaxID=8355 RepID=A0A974DXQ1_XENLA|nr:hypothetical protein XELAEV_18011148mg [Xenopus laevis]
MQNQIGQLEFLWEPALLFPRWLLDWRMLPLQQQYRECQELLSLYQSYLAEQQKKLHASPRRIEERGRSFCWTDKGLGTYIEIRPFHSQRFYTPSTHTMPPFVRQDLLC